MAGATISENAANGFACGSIRTFYGAESSAGRRQFEQGHFRPDVEADANQMAESAADIHRAATRERELALSVAPVPHRKQRRRQEGRPALTAVRMARKDPAA